ncbi:TetR/AcrR family transcriptional regulator [Paenibacillus sp. GXUN7292]|uniref:TetR/AcrR family transcriptional regulator n=1 Tax=Paenibacillus sp. GXUN7292 TaxID=3422499 RepID=UPI003D7DBB5E
MTTPSSDQDKTKRDPQGRRDTIVKAAVELLVKHGPSAITHRKVAARAEVPLGSTTYYFASLEQLIEEALGRLADEIDQELSNVKLALAESDGDLMILVDIFHDYLHNRAQVQADAALYTAGAHRAELHPLALRWFDGLVGLLSGYTDRNTALAIAVFSDGAFVHAMLHEQPLEAAMLRSTLAAMIGRGQDHGGRS